MKSGGMKPMISNNAHAVCPVMMKFIIRNIQYATISTTKPLTKSPRRVIFVSKPCFLGVSEKRIVNSESRSD